MGASELRVLSKSIEKLMEYSCRSGRNRFVRVKSAHMRRAASAEFTPMMVTIRKSCGPIRVCPGRRGPARSQPHDFRIRTDKALNIGVKPDQPGLGLQSSSGQYSGFDVDVANYVAHKLGATKINFVPTLSAN